ncbi:hypothetical protein [Micromonospora maris]|uniref:hypothetical protein n=1 Tax=Micromonospora maris TaxID=1003110 RepID=UPI002E123D9C|nr:hypothetical protein OG712_15080 [Micromonospora maris]
MAPEQLIGCFVVEVGLRQAWPFLGFCDNRSTPPQESRLYLDTDWCVEAPELVRGTVDDEAAWLTAALALNGTTIAEAQVTDDGTLLLATTDQRSLVASGQPQSAPVGEPWWLSDVPSRWR